MAPFAGSAVVVFVLAGLLSVPLGQSPESNQLMVTTRRQPTAVVASFTLDAPASIVLVRLRTAWPNDPIVDLLEEPSSALVAPGPQRLVFRRRSPVRATSVGGELFRPPRPLLNTEFWVPTPPPLEEGAYAVIAVAVPRAISTSEARLAIDELDYALDGPAIGDALARQWSGPHGTARWAVIPVPPTWEPFPPRNE